MAENQAPPEPDSVSAVVSQTPIQRFDAQMQPYLARLSGIGLVTEHHLIGFTSAIRNALAAAFAEQPGDAEILDKPTAKLFK